MNKKFYIIKATSLKHYFQFSSQFLALKEINSNFQDCEGVCLTGKLSVLSMSCYITDDRTINYEILILRRELGRYTAATS